MKKKNPFYFLIASLVLYLVFFGGLYLLEIALVSNGMAFQLGLVVQLIVTFLLILGPIIWGLYGLTILTNASLRNRYSARQRKIILVLLIVSAAVYLYLLLPISFTD